MSTSDDTSNDVELADKLKEALVINRFDSQCGACGKDANPHEDNHESELGYYPGPRRAGCGVAWKYVTSDYSGMEDTVKDMRPDLEYFDRWPRSS